MEETLWLFVGAVVGAVTEWVLEPLRPHVMKRRRLPWSRVATPEEEELIASETAFLRSHPAAATHYLLLHVGGLVVWAYGGLLTTACVGLAVTWDVTAWPILVVRLLFAAAAAFFYVGFARRVVRFAELWVLVAEVPSHWRE